MIHIIIIYVLCIYKHRNFPNDWNAANYCCTLSSDRHRHTDICRTSVQWTILHMWHFRFCHCSHYCYGWQHGGSVVGIVALLHCRSGFISDKTWRRKSVVSWGSWWVLHVCPMCEAPNASKEEGRDLLTSTFLTSAWDRWFGGIQFTCVWGSGSQGVVWTDGADPGDGSGGVQGRLKADTLFFCISVV